MARIRSVTRPLLGLSLISMSWGCGVEAPDPAPAAENTTRWFLFEWRDIPAPRAVWVGASAGPTPVRAFTWGQLKTMF